MKICSFTLLIILFANSHHVAPSIDPQAWKVTAIKTEPGKVTINSNRIFYATVTNRISGIARTVITPTYISKVNSSYVTHDKLVVMGQDNSFEEVILLDLRKSAPAQRVWGNFIHVFDGRWLVAIEWSPNHVFPPDYETDVVLARDLFSDASDDSVKAANPDDAEPYIRNAGSPIYPPSNAATGSYQNIKESPESIYSVFGQTMTLLSNNRLAFISSFGEEAHQGEQQLIVIDLLRTNRASQAIHTHSMQKVYDAVGIQKTDFLQVERLDPAGDSAVRITFTKGAYKLSDMVFPLQQP